MTRFVPNAPKDVGRHIDLAYLAANAFQPFRSPEINVALGKTDHPAGSMATGLEFLSYIQRAEPDFNAMEVNLFIANMVRLGLLMEMGPAGFGALGYNYMTVGMWTAGQAGGDLWLSELLGPALIVPSYGSATIAITGKTRTGDRDVGSGLVLDSAHIVTNKHVVEDMDVDTVLKKPLMRSPRATRTASDQYVRVVDTHPHPELDVAVIVVEPTENGGQGLIPLAGIVFRDPTWGDTATVFGYPPVPQVRDQQEGSPNLIVQGGEVVNPTATGLFGEPLFLYSAIARPGNSGGPIVAQDGRVIGLVFEGSAASGTTGGPKREKDEPPRV